MNFKPCECMRKMTFQSVTQAARKPAGKKSESVLPLGVDHYVTADWWALRSLN